MFLGGGWNLQEQGERGYNSSVQLLRRISTRLKLKNEMQKQYDTSENTDSFLPCLSVQKRLSLSEITLKKG